MHLFMMDWVSIIVLQWLNYIHKMDLSYFPILWMVFLVVLVLSLRDVMMV